jgi:glycosyltransferase involved in cell wall biosynthesis
LDERTKERLELQPDLEVHYVKRTGLARLFAEWRLWQASKPDDLVLCFHGMPPLLPVHGRVVVFFQNRYLLGVNSLRHLPAKVALRIVFERAVCTQFRRHVDEYVVQTKTMAEDLRRWHGGEPPVRVLPFADLFDAVYSSDHAADRYNFVYVASADAHKNHECLIDAWLLLAKAGLFPSLALTVGSGNRRLLDRLERLRSESEVCVYNLGVLPQERVLELYKCAGALIFPSTSESFGLPLVEAAACGLPVVAAELDYVRDVVTPVETFDPKSPLSIARAVRRFLGCPETPEPVMTASEFVERIRQL